MTTRVVSRIWSSRRSAAQERAVYRPHEGAAEHGEDCDGSTVAGLNEGQFGTRRLRWKVGRPNSPPGALEDLEDLVLAVDVVTHRHYIDAGIGQLFKATNGQSGTASGILRVADNQADLPAGYQSGQGLADDFPARRTNHIANEQDIE